MSTVREAWASIRRQVLERDGYKCTHCLLVPAKGERMAIHHKDRSGDLAFNQFANNDLSNLITLCYSCHGKEHVRMQ